VTTNNRNYSDEDEEQREKLKKDIIAGALRKSERPTTVREIGATALKNVPANIGMVQSLMKAVNWRMAQQEVLQGLNNTIVVVGQPNTGKSTLFNKIKGQTLSPTSPQAGTTRTLVRTDFGPFTLVDTPGHLPDVMASGMEQASVIVFLIDASKGLQTEDRELYALIKNMKKPTIIAVNKVDTLKGGESGDQFATEVAVLLDAPGVIPISARTGKNIAEELIPAVIHASPEAALAIGRELPAYRREAAQRIIRNATLINLAAGMEPIPFIDIPIVLGTQVRLVLRLAALYGEPLETADALKHARELITTMVSGLGLRYLAQQAAKAVPFGGDFVAGAIAGAATWSIGEVALDYYENGGRINIARLKQLYSDFFRRFRQGKGLKELREASAPSLNGKGATAGLDEPEKEILEEGTA
jgi:small GTP-binding protein